MGIESIKDEELLSRAVRACRHKCSRNKVPLWKAVSDQFALGSTYSAELCVRFGLDPDEMVK